MAYERRDYAGGAAATTLAAGINGSDPSISITAATGWPSGSNGPFVCVIDAGTASEEKVLVTSRTGTTLNTVTRGHDGTSAASHSAGATISHCIAAKDLDEANYWVAELAGAAQAASDLIIADGDNSLSRIAKGSSSTVLQVSSGGTLQYGTVTSAMITDGTIVNADISASAAIDLTKVAATNAVDETHLKTSVAGNGLAGGNGTALSVNVDDSTIAITTDTLGVKAGGIGTTQLADAGVTAAKIAAAVAGDGLTGGAGSALAVNPDNSTLEINTDAVRVKAAGITESHLATSVAGAGLTGGGGTALAVAAGTGLEISGDTIRVENAARTTYTPSWTTSGSAASIGNGTLTGRYHKLGRTCFVQINLTVGSTTGFGTGYYAFSLPFAAASGFKQAIGALITYNTLTAEGGGTFLIESGASATSLTTPGFFGGSTLATFLLQQGTPTLGTGDFLIIFGQYETAS